MGEVDVESEIRRGRSTHLKIDSDRPWTIAHGAGDFCLIFNSVVASTLLLASSLKWEELMWPVRLEGVDLTSPK